MSRTFQEERESQSNAEDKCGQGQRKIFFIQCKYPNLKFRRYGYFGTACALKQRDYALLASIQTPQKHVPFHRLYSMKLAPDGVTINLYSNLYK